MKTLSSYLYLIPVLAILGCRSETRKGDTEKSVESKKDFVEFKIPENVDSNFKDFLDYFSKDSAFQVSRVNFPLKVKEIDDNNMLQSVEKTILKTEYTKLDFEYPKDALTKKYDRYSQKIKINGNNSVVEVRGVDNGICIDVFFEKLNGKWFLKSWNDTSN
ncbi:MAG: DUF4348 domain-containing protein [Bacteroidia bacterium]|nr:DUF4348 domain-containing protein [Bacteroidia bacterium]